MIEDLKSWAGFLAVLISIGTVIANLLSAGGKRAMAALDEHKKETTAVFKELDARLDKYEHAERLAHEAVASRFSLLDTQLARIEEAMKHMPDRATSRNLELAVEKMTGVVQAMDARLSGQIETLDARLQPVAATTARLQNFLMEQGDK